jgi:hypothetical protein
MRFAPKRDKTICSLARGKNQRKNALYEGKTHFLQFRRSDNGTGVRVAGLTQKNPGFLFMILTPSSAAQLVHNLFTPVLFPPGLRRQIRNRASTSQENFRTLFCFATQKNLDEKSSLASSSFPSAAIHSDRMESKFLRDFGLTNPWFGWLRSSLPRALFFVATLFCLACDAARRT